jgi:hypothetical protein
MKISGVNPETGEEFEADAADVNKEFIQSMSDFKMTDGAVKKLIDNLDVSADVKSGLYMISQATIKAGQFILKVGRKIIDFIALTFKEYPNASFGMIFSAIVGFLISAIPIIGVVLGPFVTPILIALGLIVGLYNDIQDKALLRKITESNAKFSPLNT